MAKMMKIRIESVYTTPESSTVSGIAGPNETIVKRPLVQQSGFRSIPRSGSTGIAIQEGEDIAVIGTTDIDSDRPVIIEGEVSMHNDNEKYITIYDSHLRLAHGDCSIQVVDGAGIYIYSANNGIWIYDNGEIKIGTASNNKIELKSNDDIEITNTSNKITLKGNGDIEIGNASLKKLMTEDIISKFNNHTHISSAQGAPTSNPQISTPATIYTSADATDKTSAQ